MKLIICAVIFLGGCTITVTDNRLPPEHVTGALKELYAHAESVSKAMAVVDAKFKALEEKEKK